MATTAEIFSLAWQYHQAGRFSDAEQLYRQILQIDPADADAWCFLGAVCQAQGKLADSETDYREAVRLLPAHFSALNCLGALLAESGKAAEAVNCFQKALRIEPQNAVLHNNLGLAFARMGQYSEAAASYREARRCNPNYAEAHYNLGLALHAQKQHDQAIAEFQKTLHLRPEYPEALNDLANAYAAQEKWIEAVNCLRQAIHLRPDFAGAHFNLGIVQNKRGQVDDAIASFRQALRCKPDYLEAQLELANSLRSKGQLNEAMECGRQAIQQWPGRAEAHDNLGMTLLELGRVDGAEASCREALRIKPDFAEAHIHFGIVLEHQGKLEDAFRSNEQALRLNPKSTEACTNLAILRKQQGRYEEALELFDESLRINPDFAKAHLYRALLRLLLGDFQRGWAEYEWRWKQPGNSPRFFAVPRWDGSELHGCTVLLYSEQGLGDTLQFVRFADLVKQRGGKVIVECQPALVPLLSGNQEIDKVMASGPAQGGPPLYDFHAELMSLPAILGITLCDIPANVPYLHADPVLIEKWRRELEPLVNFRIGIAWQGSRQYPRDWLRSIPAKQFKRLAELEDVEWISLQKGFGAEQVRDLADQMNVLDLSDRLDKDAGAFMDTAAIMKNIDLVITSDSAIAHLAGGLGVPIWVALPLVPDWRWLHKGENCPWYPTMRLYRQSRYRQWEDVFDRICADLRPMLLM